ncbi:MAG: F0F1 ATP synthase subunit epsilon [Balneolaceae bacterium]|nr:F0F1 ATP synthase subunit epsilon [Balneolaceae bacterium]
MSISQMTLQIWTPEQQVLKAKTDKIIAEAVNGFFCLMPRHIDFLAELVPGILSYTLEGEESFLAVDRGILVKCGHEVMVSSRNVIVGESLEKLQQQVQEEFQKAEQKEQEISIAMNQLEADFIRRFVEMREQRTGIIQ